MRQKVAMLRTLSTLNHTHVSHGADKPPSTCSWRASRRAADVTGGERTLIALGGQRSAGGEEPSARYPMARARRFCDALGSEQRIADVLAVSAAPPRCLVPRLHLAV